MKQAHALLERLHLGGSSFARRHTLAVLAIPGRRSSRGVPRFGTLRHWRLLLHGHNGPNSRPLKSVSSYTRPGASHARGGGSISPTPPVPVWRLSHTAHRALYSVSMKLAAIFFISLCAFAAAPTTDIKVDQAGYLPHSPKLAMVVSHTLAKEFSVRRAGNDSVVLRGRLAEPANDPDSGDIVQEADFTKLDKPGKYYLEVPGVGRSWEFRHWPGCVRARVLSVHAVVLRAALRDRRGPGARVPRLQARRLSPGGRLSCFFGQDRPAHLGQRVARCRRLRPLRGQLRHLHRHAAVDLGDLRRPPQAGEAQHPGIRQRHARHPERDPLEPGLDALHAGRRWRRLAQTDQRALLRFHHAGEGYVDQLRDRHREGAV